MRPSYPGRDHKTYDIEYDPGATESDAALIFPSHSTQILRLMGVDGKTLHYAGDFEHNDALTEFTVNDVTSVVYDDPVNPTEGFIYLSDDDGQTQIISLTSGERLEITKLEDDVAFTLTTGRQGEEGFSSITGTLNQIERAAAASDNENATDADQTGLTATAASRARISTRSTAGMQAYFRTPVIEPQSVAAQAAVGQFVQISTVVTNACGPVTNGFVVNQASLGTPAGAGAVSDLFQDARATQPAVYDSGRMAFYSQIPTSILPRAGEALARIAAQESLSILYDRLSGKVIDKLAPMRRITSALRKTSAPAGSTRRLAATRIADDLDQISTFMKIKDKIVGIPQGIVDQVQYTVDVGNTLGILAGSASQGNPVPTLVTSDFTSFSDDSPDGRVSGEQLVDVPGRFPVEFDLSLGDDGDTPALSGDVEVEPANPWAGQNYQVKFSTTCMVAPTFRVQIDVKGTDGYMDRQIIPLVEGAELVIEVPGAESRVSDTVTIRVLDSDSKTVDSTEATIVFS